MKRFIAPLLTAMAFLSRLAPARHISNDAITSSVAMYPLAGAILALIATLPVLTGFGPSAIRAWVYLVLLAWLTRGLHWDGLTDIADALGSNATGEKFWTIMKDSRIGAFGVMALGMMLLGQYICVQICIDAGRIGALLWGPVLGRSLAIVFAGRTEAHPASTLARLIQPGAQSKAAGCACVLGIAAGFFCLPPLAVCIAIILAGLGYWQLHIVASRQGGMNGDFLGTIILWSETSVFLAGALSL